MSWYDDEWTSGMFLWSIQCSIKWMDKIGHACTLPWIFNILLLSGNKGVEPKQNNTFHTYVEERNITK